MSQNPVPETAPHKATQKKPSHVVRNLIALGAVGVVAIVVLIALRFTVFVPYRVPSGSMRPTVEVGEHVFASALDTDAVRGAVMVFQYPEHPSQLFLKRVVGVSGDKIAVKKGRITINGWDVPHCDVGHYTYASGDDSPEQDGNLELEYLGDSVYLVFHTTSSFQSDEGPWVVKPHEYFVMGDNRENAHDSRFWFGGAGGGVPFENTRGRLRIDPLHPKLPPNAQSNQAAFESCLRNKPVATSPPPNP